MKKVFLYFSVLLISSCSRPLSISQIKYKEIRINDSTSLADKHIEELIRPYRDSMQAEMNEVLVINDTVLTKQMPESDLGNLLAEILLDKAQKYSGKKVDAALINFGGIRLTQLAKGNVTREKAFELMPFDNKIVLLELDGKTTQLLFDRMAGAGGTPVAGARYWIHHGKAEHITIQGEVLDANKNYTIALSDYLANGGEKLDMLKDKKQTKTDVLLREAFIEGFKDIAAQGKHLKRIKDGRVKEIME